MKQFSYDILNCHTKKIILTSKLKILHVLQINFLFLLWSQCSVTWPFNDMDGYVYHKIRDFTHFNTMTAEK